MRTSKRTAVVGVFRSHDQAQQAVSELKRVGFDESRIAVVARDQSGAAEKISATDKGSKVATGAASGVAAGAGVGALYALGIATIGLPALGPVLLGGGLLASVLGSAAVGAAAAGIAGALIGLGIPEEEANYYEGEVKAGRILVTVQANGRYDEAQEILRRYGAYDIHSQGMAAAAGNSTTQPSARTAATVSAASPIPSRQEAGGTVQLHEEELRAHKQPVKAGEVKVRKEVVTEHKALDVPVEREEVVIERRPVSGRASTSDIRAGEEIRIPVKEEQVHVEKEAVVKEEVNVGKRKVQDTQHVTDTVRKEEARVEEEGKVNVKGDTTSRKSRQ